MTSMWGQLWNGRANSTPAPPPPRAVVHIDMQPPDRPQVYRRKGWSTRLWVGLKGAVLGILALRLISREKTVESFLGIMGGQGQGKPREGVCMVCPVDNLVTLPVGCDMVALQEDVLGREDHSALPFRWQIPVKLVR